ncbi:MAG TPA: TIR domain-containing protein [Rubrivivax sp.]|nr:TIR domain-containing protein [Rubrivivax sp.]
MRALKDCDFTAFISYAHADDEAWFDWVTHFRNELERSLGALLRGIKLPRFHLSGENGPVAGRLSEELKKRIDASFAMVIVVHENYAQSDWCLKELEYFHSLFGDDGFRQRLYIVAMSEPAMMAVTQTATWKRLMPDGEQLWIPFYEPSETARPLDIYLAPGLVAPAFRLPFERLRIDFAAKLKSAAALGALQRPTTTRDIGLEVAATSTSAAVADVLLGFVPPASTGAVAAAAAALRQQGIAARVLAQDTVFSDFAELTHGQHLVLAFDDSPPMLTTLAPGGHLQLQRDAWLRKGRPADAVSWLDLRSPVPPSQAWAGAAAWVATQRDVRALDLAALVERLRPKPAAPTEQLRTRDQPVRIYIESNRYERTLWEALGEQIRRKWEELCLELAPQRVPPLLLRARGLPVDQIDSFPNLDDADGVVLLWGRKTSEALVAQINKVETKMAPGRDAAPGIVAYLMPPQHSSEPVPAWGWQVLRFNATGEDAIAVVEEEGDQLTRFLKKVFQRRLQRDSVEGKP